MTTVFAEKLVPAPARLAYRAFTNSTTMRDWLCDFATADARPRGRLYLWWNGDFYSSGEFVALEESRKVSFLWHSRNEKQPTLVTVTLTEQAGGTLVRIGHAVPDEKEWEQTAQSFQQNWQWSLEALAFMLETGKDYRLARRPMLGVIPGDFTAEQAQRLGVPVTSGFRLDGAVAGMGAEAAGLQADDVIVEMNGREIRNDFGSLPAAIQGCKAGDVIPVTFYRGPEKRTVQMTLSARPMPAVPFDIPELVRQGRAVYAGALAQLEECFAGASDEQAAASPAPGEWSALETLAHLVHVERTQRALFEEIVGGHERWTDDWGGNIPAHIHATTSIYPTVRAMLDELRRNVEENLAFASGLPAEFCEVKNSFYRLGSMLLQADVHIQSHIRQIKAALEAARGA